MVPGPGATVPATLDHVAVAAESWQLAWPRYVETLGGVWVSGGSGPGFAPSQYRFANGARLEVLAPHDPGTNPFLRRFIDRSGPGPHHLTFKVPDLDRAVAAASARGLPPINEDRSDPNWQEAFLHPRLATGIVVQLAQQAAPWAAPAPAGIPPAGDRQATLVRATHVVGDLQQALDLFAGLLGGIPTWAAMSEHSAVVVDLAWADAPLGLRLVGPPAAGPVPAALTEWLRGAPGRLHHVVFSCPDPFAVPDACPLAAGDPAKPDSTATLGVLPEDGALALVPPAANLGTRLVLTVAPPGPS